MLILLTNDDGISAPGLIALYRELTKLGEVHVVAPSTVQSATGHGVTLATPLLTQKVTVADAFIGVAVDGRPADCVKLAVSQILPRRPDLVVSGMNSGANVGINVLYSGTIAAAIEGAFLGLPSLAVSLHLLKDAAPNYSRAAGFAFQAIKAILSAGLSGGNVATINVPGLKGKEVPRGIKLVRQCTRAWQDAYERRKTPRGNDYYWNTNVFTLGSTEEDTDVTALREKFITITPLQFDLTHYPVLSEWSNRTWELSGEPTGGMD